MTSLPIRPIRNIVLGIALLLLASGIGYKLGEKRAFSLPGAFLRPLTNVTQPTTSEPVNFGLFWDVWARIHRYYIDAANINTQKLVWGAISGMVNALDDPYTVFLPPKENKEFKEDIGGTFEGIGAQLDLKDNRIIIVSPLKGTPAEKAGLKPFDWIMKVDGEDTVGWALSEAVSKIRGPRGTKVVLTILSENEEKPRDVEIMRDGIIVPSVDSWMKKGIDIQEISGSSSSARLSNQSIGYIHLSRFGDRTSDEWNSAVSQVAEAWSTRKIKGMILDMRNNPGGYLDGSVFIVSEFVKSGLVVTQTNSDGTSQDYTVDRRGKLTDIPIVILINKGSASASEIVAGALRDLRRITIVGETSFGKGSVQTPQELEGGASIHITTGKWILPKGDWINKKGIAPDVSITWDNPTATNDAQLAKAIEVLLQ